MAVRYRLTVWAFFLSIPVVAGCATTGSHDAWTGPDKAKHFAASAAVSCVATTVALNHDADDGEAVMIGVAVTMPIGMGKEIYDQEVKETFWSWQDLSWDFLGAVAGAAAAISLE